MKGTKAGIPPLSPITTVPIVIIAVIIALYVVYQIDTSVPPETVGKPISVSIQGATFEGNQSYWYLLGVSAHVPYWRIPHAVDSFNITLTFPLNDTGKSFGLAFTTTGGDLISVTPMFKIPASGVVNIPITCKSIQGCSGVISFNNGFIYFGNTPIYYGDYGYGGYDLLYVCAAVVIAVIAVVILALVIELPYYLSKKKPVSEAPSSSDGSQTDASV